MRAKLIGLVLVIGVACSEGESPPAGKIELEANLRDYTSLETARRLVASATPSAGRDTLRALLDRYPDYVQLRTMLHNAYLNQRHWAAALALYADFAPTSLTSSQRHHLAKVALKAGEVEAAERLIAELADGDDEIGVTMALVEYEMGDPSAALARLEPLWANVAPKRNPEAHWLRGMCLLYEDRLDEARSTLEELLTYAPAFWPGHYALGRVLSAQGLPGEAEARFEAFETNAAEYHRQATVQMWLAGRSFEVDDAARRRDYGEAASILRSMIARTESDSLRYQFEQALLQMEQAAGGGSK